MRQDAYCPLPLSQPRMGGSARPASQGEEKAIKNVREQETKHPSPLQATIIFVENPEKVADKLLINKWVQHVY